MGKIAVLLVGFGGPQTPEEVRPFLESVVHGRNIPEARFNAVVSHYEKIGGRSPYNAVAFSQKKALEARFKNERLDLPVYVAFRHSTPSLKETFLTLKKDKVEKVIVFVLSPLRSEASFGRYEKAVAEANKETAEDAIKVEYTETFFKDPLFIVAQSKRVEETLLLVPPADREKTYFLFSAHSIPEKMSTESGYAEQFSEGAALISKNAGLKFWNVAYQSRSGNPAEPWLGPDVKDAARQIDKGRFRNAVVVPLGFTNDNAEILYDLDVDLRQTVVHEGLRYFRTPTVGDDPLFIEMIRKLVSQKFKAYA